MKVNLFRMGVVLAAAALFSWNPAIAQRRGPVTPINAEPAERPVASNLASADYGTDADNSGVDASGACDACNSCNSCGPCGRRGGVGGGLCADCDEDRYSRVNIAGFASMDTWRGPADGSFQSNFGSVTGLNAGAPLPFLDRLGIGGQLGASYGVFDWAGRESNGAERQNQPQQQIFVTTGIFRRAKDCQLFNWGIGFDWMFNRNFGVLAQSPTMGQWRAMVGVNLNTWNELGVWGTVSQIEDSKLFDGSAALRLPTGTVINYRPRSQANLFWHHKYAFGGDTWLWVGATERPRLGARGTQTPIIIGGSMNVPLNYSLAIYGSFTYVTSSFASANAVGSENDITNIQLGLAWYPGAKARSRTVAGRCWAPYLPMANNGNFFVDTNGKY